MPCKRSKASPVQCEAIAANGQRCKAKPHKDGLCFFHSDPQRAAELGRNFKPTLKGQSYRRWHHAA